MKKVKVGLIGCGSVSEIYLKNCTESFNNILDIVACSDIDIEKAKVKSAEYSIPKVCTVKEIIEDPEIEIILSLTNPIVHADINLSALEAGKNIYTEKPLAVTLEDGKKIIETAKKRNLLIGCATDNFLGGGNQTCRKLIDDGWIGRPIAASAFWVSHGAEDWHPDPEYYYKVGAGPMFDMGPYYLNSLINLLGPVKRVTGFAQISFAERTITSQPKYGKKIKVETPTHITGILDFESGALATIMTTFDIWYDDLPSIEIYGSEGSISVKEPLYEFGFPVFARRIGESQWSEIPLTHGYNEFLRGLGVAEMANSLRNGRPNRTNGELAYHVLEVMHGFLESAEQGKVYEVKSTCKRPDPMPMGSDISELEK